MCKVDLLDGRFTADSSTPTSWTHMMVNYIGPNDGQGIRVYYDGTEVASVTTKYEVQYSAGDGRIIVGRCYIDDDSQYASMQFDEMIFFNEALSTTDIKLLYSAV